MKKTAFASILIFAFLFSGVKLVKITEANPYWTYHHIDPVPDTVPPSIIIYNPKNDTSYTVDRLTVNILVSKAVLAEWHCNIEEVEYSIDGRTFNLYPLMERSAPDSEIHITADHSVINFTLSSLASGKHTLTVQASVAVTGGIVQVFFLNCNSTVYFTTDVAPPVISDLSVENKTYNEFDLPLNFTVNEPPSWMGYNLDNQANVTVNGAIVLGDLSVGSHNVTVYAEDAAGNMGASETVYFTIEEPFPTSLVIASVIPATVVLVGIGLLLYGIKRK